MTTYRPDTETQSYSKTLLPVRPLDRLLPAVPWRSVWAQRQTPARQHTPVNVTTSHRSKHANIHRPTGRFIYILLADNNCRQGKACACDQKAQRRRQRLYKMQCICYILMKHRRACFVRVYNRTSLSGCRRRLDLERNA